MFPSHIHLLLPFEWTFLGLDKDGTPDPVNCVALGTAMSLGIGDKLETGFTDATPRIGRR